MNTLPALVTASFIFLCTGSFAQNDSAKATVYKADTVEIRYYNAILRKDSNWRGVTFMANDIVIDKETYEKYSAWAQILRACTPCYLKAYNANGLLQGISLQYTDCPVGSWIEYYPDGVVKVKGQYVENDTGNWDNLVERGFCSRTGLWQYFDEKGNIIKTETYKNGKVL